MTDIGAFIKVIQYCGPYYLAKPGDCGVVYLACRINGKDYLFVKQEDGNRFTLNVDRGDRWVESVVGNHRA